MGVRGGCWVRTDACFLVLGPVEEVVGVEVGHLAQLLSLVLVEVDGVLVEDVLDCVGAEFIVGVQSVQMLDRLGCPAQVVVDLEVAAKFGLLLQLAQEW